jgi:hypothetical protein
MNAVNNDVLFEECLKRLNAGAELEEVLADYPHQADELRPMLLAALKLQQISGELKPSQSAQMRSRAQFLTAAARMASTSQKQGFRFSLFHLRLAASSAIVIGILAAVLILGTGFASADALPGDVFYPVKIIVEQMQINLVQDPPARLQMEDTYDDRRQQEVARLTQLQRREQVTFSGYLQNAGAGKWQIGSVSLVFPASGLDPANYENAYVEITGMSDSEVVEVQSIELHRLQWEGVLQQFDDQTWVISGMKLQVTEDTEISGSPQTGATVEVIAVRPSGDQYQALSLTVKSLPATAEQVLPQASKTPAPENGESGEPGENKQPTSEPRIASPSPRPEFHPSQTGEPGEENNKQPNPSPTATKKDDEERRSTRTPSSGSNPTRTPTSVSKPTKTPTSLPDTTSTPKKDD